MPISVTCTNPDCRQPCMVPDDHAGRIVRCPKCPAVIHVPLHAVPDQPIDPSSAENFELDLNQFHFPPDAPAPSPSATPAPPPPDMPPPPRQDLYVILSGFFRRCGVAQASMFVLAAALACNLLLILSIMLPWQSVRGFESYGHYRVGIATVSGSLSFFFTLGVSAFLVTVVVTRQPFLFEFALWSFTGWAAISTLWRVVDIITFHGSEVGIRTSAAFGLYLALLFSIGAVGASCFVVFHRLLNQKRRK